MSGGLDAPPELVPMINLRSNQPLSKTTKKLDAKRKVSTTKELKEFIDKREEARKIKPKKYPATPANQKSEAVAEDPAKSARSTQSDQPKEHESTGEVDLSVGVSPGKTAKNLETLEGSAPKEQTTTEGNETKDDPSLKMQLEVDPPKDDPSEGDSLDDSEGEINTPIPSPKQSPKKNEDARSPTKKKLLTTPRASIPITEKVLLFPELPSSPPSPGDKSSPEATDYEDDEEMTPLENIKEGRTG